MRRPRVDAGRKALLLGTALASTLLFGSLFTVSDAAAQARKVEFRDARINRVERTDGLVIELAPINLPIAPQNTTEPDQSFRLIMDAAVVNSGAITDRYAAAIGIVVYNDTIAIGNVTPPVDTVAIAQRTAVESQIVINNRAALTAEIGFRAAVMDRAVAQYNIGHAEHIESDDFVTLTQISRANQENADVTAIRIENNGDIVSTENRVVILNDTTEMRNEADVLNLSSGDGDSLTQITDVDQENLLDNTITIETRRAIVAEDVGLGILVQNTGTYLYNGCLCNENDSATGFVDNITQSAFASQTNVIANAITIENRSGIVADQFGISATVQNVGVELVNKGAAVNEADYGGYITQTAEVDQTNTVANAIVINNEAAIQAASGIQAEIINDSPILSNVGELGNLTGAPPPQSAASDQTNIIANGIAIANSGDIVTSLVGIAAFTQNDIPTLSSPGNQALIYNLTLTNDPGVLTQSILLGQINVVANATAIENSGNIDSAIAGITAIVLNEVAFLPNTQAGPVSNISFSDSGGLVQSLSVEQYNSLESEIAIENSGTITSQSVGITALVNNDTPTSGLDPANMTFVDNGAAIGTVAGDVTQSLVGTQTNLVASDISIENLGTIGADIGIIAAVLNDLTIINVGGFANDNLASVGGDLTQSMKASQAGVVTNLIAVENTGTIQANAYGIIADITNRIEFYNFASAGNMSEPVGGQLIQSLNLAQTNTVTNDITIVNQGEVSADGVAILAEINNEISFNNSACLTCNSGPATVTQSSRLENNITIVNSGSVIGGEVGIAAGITRPVFFDIPVFDPATNNTDHTVDSRIVIENTGLITAESLFAIDTYGARTTIINAGGGVIEGFVDLTDRSDRFLNQTGGIFEARQTSDFDGGTDLFRNDGTVQAATDASVSERSAFVNLERFENRGLISLVDGRVGDTFTISNTSPAARDLSFVASGDSTLAVDAFLGGPGSVADEFIVYGDISGKTALQVNNTNANVGAAGAVIPVIVAESDKVKSDAFFLAQPIDTGFFQYDLFFRPTGSGVFELRSFAGPGAVLLPQLITGTQDIWHQGSSTWFDRTADLRVLLAGGATPIAYNPNGGNAGGTAQGTAMTPAVWARGAGAWLDRDATETVTAFGNTYRFDLGRDLDVLDWQMGLDLGTRDLVSPGDILVFGLLGGFVGASLDYNQIARHFDFSGGQIGGYATYLNGGLFVDTLLNAHLLEMETRQLGFANSLDANTLGLRTDAGYRFGNFSGGAFVEPLATIAVLWSDIDGFTNGGNQVSFDDEANVRGRLGLRVGTSYPVWAGTTMEPFVIGSLWGHLSGDNQATLTSTGTTFRFEDDLDDVWGEVSAGVNFFNPSAATAVFAKVDVTFGDDIDGIGGKAGMRVSW